MVILPFMATEASAFRLDFAHHAMEYLYTLNINDIHRLVARIDATEDSDVSGKSLRLKCWRKLDEKTR